ncbi:MAG: peptidoglycan endopeptidase [Veillonella sp.]|nr:peptidoglycan endopeptidase [Veillonella sp.]
MNIIKLQRADSDKPNTNESTGQKIANAAISWLGTPYQNNAMVRGVGVDCAYLLVAAVVESGLMPKDKLNIEDYSNEWHLHHSEEKYLKYVEQVADKVDLENDILEIPITCRLSIPRGGDTIIWVFGAVITQLQQLSASMNFKLIVLRMVK